MFSNYVDGDTFNARELSYDVFCELYTANEIDGYRRDKDSDVDSMNAWEYWEDTDMFVKCLEVYLSEQGYVEWDDNSHDGAFIWMQDYESLTVKPGNSELPTDIVATFDRDSLYETVYAQGVVRDGTFYATVIARELD
nr:MAG TPA: hypothetical protein [Caudoviricetes sp.]